MPHVRDEKRVFFEQYILLYCGVVFCCVHQHDFPTPVVVHNDWSFKIKNTHTTNTSTDYASTNTARSVLKSILFICCVRRPPSHPQLPTKYSSNMYTRSTAYSVHVHTTLKHNTHTQHACTQHNPPGNKQIFHSTALRIRCFLCVLRVR